MYSPFPPQLDQVLQGYSAQLHQQQQQLAQMQVELNALRASVGSFQPEIKWPLQFRAGLIKYPKKQPVPFFQVVEVKTFQQSSFGETRSEAQGVFSVDRSCETFLTKISAVLYQQDWEGERPNDVPYRTRFTLDFEWKLTYGDDDLSMSSDWLPATLLLDAKEQGLTLPTEREISQHETLTLHARPLVSVGSGSKFVLKFVLHLYKMISGL